VQGRARARQRIAPSLGRLTRRIAGAVALGALAVSLVGAAPPEPTAAVSNRQSPASPVSSATYHPMTPVRLLDTRSGNGLSVRLVANTPATFQIGGRGGVPDGAAAVTGNLTVVDPSFAWAVYLGPSPVAYPTTSALNFVAGDVKTNGVTVALGSAGSLSATYMSTPGNTTDLVFDVTGYFTGDQSGASYHPVAPVRLLDSRSNNGLSGRLVANTPATFQIGGRGGVPEGATAVTGNLTVVDPSFAWAVYLGPDPVPSPGTSTLNFARGEVKANGVTVALGSGGSLSATYMSTPGNTTDLVFDVTGYYTADDSGAVYIPVAPARLLDSRADVGLTRKLVANTPATFQIGGRGGIPTSATAVTGNLTVVNPSFAWAVYLGPSPVAYPTTSALNFVAGDVKANGVTVALGSGGTLSATYMSLPGNTTDLVFDVTGYYLGKSNSQPAWAFDLFSPAAERWQDPDMVACTAAAAQSMLNTVAAEGPDGGLVWRSTTDYSTQESIMAFERNNMTMLTSSAGTDPHGWRNALNYYGWGSLTAGVYRDSAYGSFDAASKAAVAALATYHKPVGILAHAGGHAEFITGYEVTGDDPSTGSMDFEIVGVDLTDPLAANARRDSWITAASWQSGGVWVQFGRYLETDSPYRDPIDGQTGYAEWYGNWVLIDPIK
jgi:hypothetical protein